MFYHRDSNPEEESRFEWLSEVEDMEELEVAISQLREATENENYTRSTRVAAQRALDLALKEKRERECRKK